MWNKMKQIIPSIAKDNYDRIERNAAYARLCILDAFAGRLKNGLASNSKRGWLIYTIFSIQTSTWLFRTVMCACVFHTFSIFFEPEHACSSSMIYYLLQLVVLLVYSFDIGLKMYYEGLKVGLVVVVVRMLLDSRILC